MTEVFKQLILQLVSGVFAALLVAVIIQFAIKWIFKFKPPFGMAYQAALVSILASIILGFLVALLVVSVTKASGADSSTINLSLAISMLSAIVLGFFVQIFVYAKMLKHPETGAIGLKSAFYISGIQLLIGIVILTALAAISIPAYQDYVEKAKRAEAQRQATDSISSIGNQLLNIANEVTRNAPQMVDSDTRLDGAVAGPGLRITYFYTLPNIDSSQVAPGVFNSTVVPTVEKSACSSGELKPFFDSGVSVMYDYRGKDGNRVGLVEVNRAKCGIK